MEFLYTGLLAYLLGSIPNGLIWGKLVWHIDLRQHGSNNIGATNAYRVLGKKAAALIFLLDLCKGIFGVALAGCFSTLPAAFVLGGIMAIVGHNWSLFLKFTGGKGVATGLGVIVMLMPQTAAIVFFVWCIIVYISKYVSLASIVAAALVPICAYWFAMPNEYLGFAVLAALFVIYRHKANIKRLLNGNESKIKAKSAK